MIGLYDGDVLVVTVNFKWITVYCSISENQRKIRIKVFLIILIKISILDSNKHVLNAKE